MCLAPETRLLPQNEHLIEHGWILAALSLEWQVKNRWEGAITEKGGTEALVSDWKVTEPNAP